MPNAEGSPRQWLTCPKAFASAAGRLTLGRPTSVASGWPSGPRDGPSGSRAASLSLELLSFCSAATFFALARKFQTDLQAAGAPHPVPPIRQLARLSARQADRRRSRQNMMSVAMMIHSEPLPGRSGPIQLLAPLWARSWRRMRQVVEERGHWPGHSNRLPLARLE